MNATQERALYQLAGNSLANVSAADLFKLTNEHPYFSAAQFFLTYKLKEEGHGGFLPQLQKTALYFNNPHWLHYQLLHKNEPIKILAKEYQEPQTIPLLNRVVEEEIKASTTQQAETVTDAEGQGNKSNYLEEKKESLKPFTFHIPTMEVVKDTMDSIQEQPVDVLPREIDVQEEVVDNATENSITSFALEATQEYMYAVPKEVSKIRQAVEADEEIMIGETQGQETVNIVENALEEKDNAEAGTSSEEQEPTGDDLAVNDKLANLLNQQLEDFNKPVTEETELPIENEPYHTVDYFASQGIRPNADHGSQDRLSIQLRRFTDWLKVMKHAEAEPKDLGTDPELETAIQGIAQTSNEARDVVTETMAEVLEKQGKKDRAIQLYIKLSFLNPDKSAYFAAKIQQLKGI